MADLQRIPGEQVGTITIDAAHEWAACVIGPDVTLERLILATPETGDVEIPVHRCRWLPTGYAVFMSNQDADALAERIAELE